MATLGQAPWTRILGGSLPSCSHKLCLFVWKVYVLGDEELLGFCSCGPGQQDQHTAASRWRPLQPHPQLWPWHTGQWEWRSREWQWQQQQHGLRSQACPAQAEGLQLVLPVARQWGRDFVLPNNHQTALLKTAANHGLTPIPPPPPPPKEARTDSLSSWCMSVPSATTSHCLPLRSPHKSLNL